MITIEQVQKAFGDVRIPFKNKDVDHDFVAISLLREKIPYEACHSIIQGAEHDVLYLCDVEETLNYLSEEDLDILADCNVWYDEDNRSFALYV
jgi:hypothetical protein